MKLNEDALAVVKALSKLEHCKERDKIVRNEVDEFFNEDSLFNRICKKYGFQKERKKQFCVTTRYNASRAPFEFSIHNGKEKIIARFTKEKNIYKSDTLTMVSWRDERDNPISFELDKVSQEFKEALDYLFPYSDLSLD